MNDLTQFNQKLDYLIALIERAVPAQMQEPDFDAANAFIWEPKSLNLSPVINVSHVSLSLLKGIEHVKSILLENTKRFASDFPANNALLWGARGMGKSSLVKAVHAEVNTNFKEPLKLVEIHREDIHSLPIVLNVLKASRFRFILYCDDMSFDHDDTDYKSLKAVLEGGIEGRPANVLLYATSNRRHLMPREMIDNERSTAINPDEAIEEKISLSDRFGLWLGFHKCSQDDYLAMIRSYADDLNLKLETEKLNAQALEWSATRGSRSGRVAWQFIQNLAGQLQIKLDENPN